MLDVLWSPRPQAVRPVHQWQLLGETTGEPGPFGGPNNNVNGRAEGQEAQPDRPVLRKALLSEGGLLGKKQWQGLFQPETLPWLTSRWQPNAIAWCFCSESETVWTIMGGKFLENTCKSSLILQWCTEAIIKTIATLATTKGFYLSSSPVTQVLG